MQRQKYRCETESELRRHLESEEHPGMKNIQAVIDKAQREWEYQSA